MPLPALDGLWRLVRRVDDVFVRTDRAFVLLEKLTEDIRVLERRVSALEIREDLLVEKTRTAAATAAAGAVTVHLVDMARRIGALEARGGRLGLE